jgi:cell wall-associated NlpC family hydrolase
MASAALRRPREALDEAWTEKYLSTPFMDRGMSLEGCDCWSLVGLVYAAERGICLPDYAEVSGSGTPEAYRTIVREKDGPEWAAIPAGQEEAFDVVLMRGQIEVEGRKASRPTHVGLVVHPGRLMHIERGTGVSVVDYRRHPSIKCRVISFHRYRSQGT